MDLLEVIVTILLIFAIAALFLALLILPLLRALKLKDSSDKIAWVLIIIFLYPIGSLIFLVAKPDKPKKVKV